MIYYEELTFLPKIEEQYLDSLETIETFENVFPDKEFAHTYASYSVPTELAELIQQYFDYPVLTRYQVIKKQLPIHTDVGIKGFKCNYLLTSGGESVKTRWWDKIETPNNVVYEMTCKLNTWYNLNIEIPHDISDVTGPRISITVRKK